MIDGVKDRGEGGRDLSVCRAPGPAHWLDSHGLPWSTMRTGLRDKRDMAGAGRGGEPPTPKHALHVGEVLLCVLLPKFDCHVIAM